jgi:hypothetical protein
VQTITNLNTLFHFSDTNMADADNDDEDSYILDYIRQHENDSPTYSSLDHERECCRWNTDRRETRESLVLNAKRSRFYGLLERDEFWAHREKMKLIKQNNLQQEQQCVLDSDAYAHKLLLRNINNKDIQWEEDYWHLKKTYIPHDWNPRRYMHSFPHINHWWSQYTHEMEQAYVHDLKPHLVSFTREHENRWILEYRHELSIRKMWEKRWSSMQRTAEWERFESNGSLIPLVKMSEKRLDRIVQDMSKRLLDEERNDGFHYLKWDVQKFVIEDQEKYMQEKSTISEKHLP